MRATAKQRPHFYNLYPKIMKLSRTHIAAGLTRKALLIAVSVGLSAVAAYAAQDNVTVPLEGKAFGQQSGSSVDLHAESTALVNPSAHYYYRISGTCHGTGDFASFVGPNTKIADLVDMIQDGASKSLVGVRNNPGGNLPFPVLNKTYQGSDSGFEFTLTIKINITATGLVKFDVENVSVTGFFTPNGTIEFEPGAKVDAGVAPVIKMDAASRSVGESAGTISVKVDRTGNLGAPVSVHFATAPGTATNADFASKSGTIAFAAGEGSKTVKIRIKEDTLGEGDEKFSVTLSKPIAAILGTPKATAVTIPAND